MERQLQMAEKDSGCFSLAKEAKTLTSSEFDNRGCQPLSPSFFSHSLYSYPLAVLILLATM